MFLTLGLLSNCEAVGFFFFLLPETKQEAVKH